MFCGFSCLSRAFSRRCPLEPRFEPAAEDCALPVPVAEAGEWLGLDLFEEDDCPVAPA